jgi:xanthine dehydrogenase accessory factor
MRKLANLVVLIKGAGEMASAVACRLQNSHFYICLTEIERPLAVSRGTTFSEAIFDGKKTIEGITAELTVCTAGDIEGVWRRGNIPLIIDPEAKIRNEIKPDVLVDSISAKRNTGTAITDAPLVIGLGPGFYAGRDAHVVVETLHHNSLGRVIHHGTAIKDNKTPVSLGGLSSERVVWAVHSGIFITEHEIGESVVKHQILGRLDMDTIEAPVDGMLRGLVRSGVCVPEGAKVVEIDPVHDKAVCDVVRDKWRAVAGGVLEAIMWKSNV